MEGRRENLLHPQGNKECHRPQVVICISPLLATARTKTNSWLDLLVLRSLAQSTAATDEISLPMPCC